MNKVIEIKNLYVDYDFDEETPAAINNVSADIYENEFVCILGPSGCGKSTLLKTIAGFVPPFKGSIEMHKVPITQADKLRGVVFQEPNLLPWFTVKENVVLGPKMAGVEKDELDSIAKKFLEQVELSEYHDTKVFELSGGQKQRVAIARTLANTPEVILMDEPFGALDSFTRAKMQNMIRRLWKANNSTICFVTHDIEEALLLGTKIYVMKKGNPSIIKTYSIDFTNQILSDSSKKLTETEEFIHLKDEILSLLEV